MTAQSAVWIMKPVGRAQGKGIFLFNKLSQISEWKSDKRWKPDNPQVESYVVQQYIPNPYLIGGKKFDLRMYALVPSFNPLTVWLYRAGFARFTAMRYSSSTSIIENTEMHLTNVAIQKHGEHYNADVSVSACSHPCTVFLTLALTDWWKMGPASAENVSGLKARGSSH